MIIAFIDMLGFSWLIDNYTQVAEDNLYRLSMILGTKESDNRTHPVDSYEECLRNFAENSALTSFNDFIFISDSMIISSEDPNLFIKQISNLISTAFLASIKYFRDESSSIDEIIEKNTHSLPYGSKVRGECFFPILFRGGISSGNSVEFVRENRRINCVHDFNGVTVYGRDYLEAVRLERSGKGPRLFCSEKFFNEAGDDNAMFFKVSNCLKEEVIYELIWTYFIFETNYCSSNKLDNLTRCLRQTVLPAVINLYKMFEADIEKEPHYLELGKVIYEGAKLYSELNNIEFEPIKAYFEESAPNFVE